MKKKYNENCIFAFRQIKSGKFVTGTNFYIVPHRQMYSRFKPPILVEGIFVEKEMEKRMMNPEWIEAVEVVVVPADTEMVKTGKWKYRDRKFPFCSVCGMDAALHADRSFYLSSYCPNCGAKMKQ